MKKRYQNSKSKKQNKSIFNTAVFIKVITEIIKNIYEILKNMH